MAEIHDLAEYRDSAVDQYSIEVGRAIDHWFKLRVEHPIDEAMRLHRAAWSQEVWEAAHRQVMSCMGWS